MLVALVAAAAAAAAAGEVGDQQCGAPVSLSERLAILKLASVESKARAPTPPIPTPRASRRDPRERAARAQFWQAVTACAARAAGRCVAAASSRSRSCAGSGASSKCPRPGQGATRTRAVHHVPLTIVSRGCACV